MKYIIVAILLGASTAYAGITLLKDTKIAELNSGLHKVGVYKVEDKVASTICYITFNGQVGTHAISCVK